MLTITDLYSIIDGLAPFKISSDIVSAGGYDNSGIIVREHQNVSKILFSVDLSVDAVKRAKRLGCDTIVTHHPAIYAPIKQLDSLDANSSALIEAIRSKMNIISAHLNLDEAKEGIDFCLAQALGATSSVIIEKTQEGIGYGREFCLNKTNLKEFVAKAKKQLGAKKITYYGRTNFEFNKVASFCGAGGSHAQKAVELGVTDAQVIVTTDLAHHQIKFFIESGRALVIPTHYASENYGFKKFYQAIAQKLSGNAKAYYFEDKRFL